MINKAILIGNIGFIGDKKSSNSGVDYIFFSVATSYNKKTSWHNCTAFGKTANFIAEKSAKGDKVYIDGTIDYSEYEKEGVKQKKTSIIVSIFQKLSWSTESKEQPSLPSFSKSDNSPSFNDDEIPF